MRILPAGIDQGISFFRLDLPSSEADFEACWDRVSGNEICTTLGNSYGHQMATVEHLLAAFYALGIDNVCVLVDGPEVPVMDGSAMPFVTALLNAGVRSLGMPRELIVIRRPVRLQYGDRLAEFVPNSTSRTMVSIGLEQRGIGDQSITYCLSPTSFVCEIAPARNFSFTEHFWHLRRRGRAVDNSIKRSILSKEGRVENLEGLRFADEFVRHQVLDIVGDLALAGHPIIGHYRGRRTDHRLNHDLMRLLMHDTRAWQRISAQALVAGTRLDQGPEAANNGASPPEAVSEAMSDAPAASLSHKSISRVRRLFRDHEA